MGLKCRTGFLKSIRFSRHLYRAIILVKILFFRYGQYGHFGQKCRLFDAGKIEHFNAEEVDEMLAYICTTGPSWWLFSLCGSGRILSFFPLEASCYINTIYINHTINLLNQYCHIILYLKYKSIIIRPRHVIEHAPAQRIK